MNTTTTSSVRPRRRAEVAKTAASLLRAASPFPSSVRGISALSQGTRGLTTLAPSPERRKKSGAPARCTALLAASRSQRSDDFAIFPFGKGFHRLSGNVAQRSRGQHEFRARLIIGKFRDDHSVILSHGQVPGVNLSSRSLCSLLGSVEPRRALLDFCSSLLGVADQRNEVRHTAFLLIRD